MYLPTIERRSVFPDTRGELAVPEQQRRVDPIPHMTTYTSNKTVQTQKLHHHNPFTWVLRAACIAESADTSPSSPTTSLSSLSCGALTKRSADTNPDTLTSVLVGVLVTAFVICAGGFLYAYRRSIRFRKHAHKSRRHRRRRRASGTSKISQGSDVGGEVGSDGDPAGDGNAAGGGSVAADTPTEA
ncbi:hypothetical protein F4808DRAFT_427946 [Astrocystis sublimbata]|nr:hypothetical protein F4808DRAFT_427946 [Astrocystis sublimbata]